jgi:hypothetical protein
VEGDIDAVTRCVDLLRLKDIAFKDLKVGKIGESTIIDLGQIEYMDRMPVMDEGLDDKGSKFSCTACYENPHYEDTLGGRVFKTPPINLKFFDWRF